MSRSAINVAESLAKASLELAQVVAPRLRKLAALERHLINNQSSRRFDDPLVQLDFEKALAKDKNLSKDKYLREVAPESVKNSIRRRFGDDGYVLLSSKNPAEIFRVYAGMVSATRYRHFDADGGVRMTDVLARMDQSQQKALWDLIKKNGLPPPMGIRPPGGGARNWKEYGHKIFWTNFGFAVLNRGREVMFRLGPISKMVGEGKQQIRSVDLHKPAHGMLDHADCVMTMHDAVLATRGFTPIYGGVILRKPPHGPKPVTKGGRLHRELTLQLAFLTGDLTWLTTNGQKLSNKIATLRKQSNFETLAPAITGKNSNPHTDLSADDCCKMLMQDPDAPRVEYSSIEIEHSLGQRVANLFDHTIGWLGVPELAARLDRLNGVYDPANVRAVSPVQHFMVDGFAAFYYKPLRQGIFAPAGKRLGMLKGGKKNPLYIPGRPYLQFDDPRKPFDMIAEIEAALAKRKAKDPEAPKGKGLSPIVKKLKDEARKVSYEEKARASILRISNAIAEIDQQLASGKNVPLDEILDAIGHAGADRVKNPFVAMDGAGLMDLVEITKEMPPASAAPSGYPRQQVTSFYNSIAAAAKEYNIDVSVLEGKY